MEGTRGHYVKENKPATEREVHMFTFICGSLKIDIYLNVTQSLLRGWGRGYDFDLMNVCTLYICIEIARDLLSYIQK